MTWKGRSRVPALNTPISGTVREHYEETQLTLTDFDKAGKTVAKITPDEAMEALEDYDE